MFENDILEFDNRMLHLNVAYEQACFEQSLNLRKIHNKVILENAVFEDASELYVAEAKESGKKKQNILVRLIETIKNFIVKVLNKITGGKFEPKNDKKIPFDPRALIAQGNDCLNKITQALKSPKGQTAGKAVIAVGAAAGAAKAGSIILKKAQQGPTLKEINDFMKRSKERLTLCQEIVRSENSLDEEKRVAQGYINELGTITSRLGRVVNSIRSGDELTDDTKLETQKVNDARAPILNGMTTAELKKEHTRLTAEIEKINKSNSVFNTLKGDMRNRKDKTGYNKAYTKERRELDAARKAKLQKQLEHCEYLLGLSARRDASNDNEFLQSNSKNISD